MRMLFAALALTVSAGLASGQVYDFTINSTPSGLSGTAGIDVDTTGTLIGNYDATSNPTGTRTKPGIFGTFGETENVAVGVTLGVALSGPVNSHASGGFRMGLEMDSGAVSFSNYSVNFLQSGPVSLPSTLALSFASFRTRNPTSTYIGGIPLNIPFGDASMTRLEAEQIAPTQGTLVSTGPGLFDFSVTAPVNITAEFTFLGTPLALPALPAAITLEGQISVSGTTAHLLSIQPFTLSNSTQPGIALPQFPLDLPTILPPGLTASVLFDLTLDTITSGLNTTLTTDATGTLIPAPDSLALAGLALATRRRRR